jgi:hypothetical protein
MRYSSKEQLLEDVQKEYRALCASLEAIPRARYREPGVWGDGWTLHDLVAHLAAWHRLFLGWYETGLRGGTPHLPAEGYKWSELSDLNRAIWAEHKDRPTDDVQADFAASYAQILDILQRSSPEQLLEPGAFPWTRDHGLVTYLGGNTSSHYRFASKVLRRWLRQLQGQGHG